MESVPPAVGGGQRADPDAPVITHPLPQVVLTRRSEQRLRYVFVDN